MDQYLVSARKYRPSSWDTVVGQESITSTLENAVKTNHIAQAYLFCGPRGVGKTTCARIFAHEINRTEGDADDKDFSFNIFELDAASNNTVDDIRSLTDQVRVPPQTGNYKVYIIDEVHMLSTQAFNAFLKTLEEPPPHAIFILATTEKHKIIPTILSRCQIFDFHRISEADMVSHLAGIAEKEGVNAESEALHVIAEKADGALRDALSIFDQCVSFSGKDLTYKKVIENLNVLDHEYYFKIGDLIRKADIPNALVTFDEILRNGFDGHHFLTGLGEHFRDLLVCTDEKTVPLLEKAETLKKRYHQQSKEFSPKELMSILELINKADYQYNNSKNARLLVEITLMQICTVASGAEKKNDKRIVIMPPDGWDDPEWSEESGVGNQQTEDTPQSTESKNPDPPKKEEKPQQPNTDNAPTTNTPPPPSATDEPVTTRRKIDRKKRRSLKKTGSISISGTLNQKSGNEEEEEVDEAALLANKPRTAFNGNQLLEVWKGFVNKMKAEGRDSYASTLSKREPQVKDNFVIELEIDNKVQEEDFNEAKSEIVEYLRDKLNNYGITVVTKLTEKDDSESLYSPKDRFKKMVEKNPKLIELKNKLDLDIDF